MGMSYWAEIVVGLPHDNVDEELSNQIREEEFYGAGIEDKSPYYDGGGCGLFGITVKSCNEYGYSKIDFDKVVLKVNEARYTFKQHIGIEPNVYLTTRGA